MYHKSIGSPQRYLSKKLHRRRSEFWPTYRRWIIGAISSLLMVLIIYIIMTSIVYAPRYQIVDLQITHGDSSTSEQSTIDQYIYQIIGNDTSYLSLRGLQRKNDVTMIRDSFPLIESVTLDDFANNTLQITVQYYTPRIIRNVPSGEKFGSYNGYLYTLATGYVLNGDEAILYLPSYLEGITSLDGIYHETSESDFVNVYHTVNDKIPLKHMIVYPGAGYVAMMTNDDLKILMSLRKPIEDQMTLYSRIYQYYPEAYRIRQIDVGSLDDAIVTLE